MHDEARIRYVSCLRRTPVDMSRHNVIGLGLQEVYLEMLVVDTTVIVMFAVLESNRWSWKTGAKMR